MKIYLIRHQAAGTLHAFPFAQPPTETQKQALAKLCFQRHGFGHPKTPDEPYWLRVDEYEILGPDAAIEVPDTTLTVVNEAGMSQFSVSGVGRVDPPV